MEAGPREPAQVIRAGKNITHHQLPIHSLPCSFSTSLLYDFPNSSTSLSQLKPLCVCVCACVRVCAHVCEDCYSHCTGELRACCLGLHLSFRTNTLVAASSHTVTGTPA